MYLFLSSCLIIHLWMSYMICTIFLSQYVHAHTWLPVDFLLNIRPLSLPVLLSAGPHQAEL